MAYPFLPVNPCCTDVVLNTPCGCSSTITNSGCNNNDPCSTHLTASSTIVYDGPTLPCIVAEPCDTLNVILQKIDEIICNLLTQINYLTNQVTNITNQIIMINGDIINIYNTLGECCGATTTTTSTTTAAPCESFSLNNTGDDPVAIIITDCVTGEQEAIVLLPGDTNICVETDSPLTVPGTVIVTPNGPCGPTTTTTTTLVPTTTTTTTAIACECLTFYNGDSKSQVVTYTDCNGIVDEGFVIDPFETVQVCGCCALTTNELVTISVGANCIDGACPAEPTTTTTTTESVCDCFDTEITILSETLASTDNNELTVLYNDCFTNPYINTYDTPGVYSLGCVNYLVGVVALGIIDFTEQNIYVPVTVGSPCCDVEPTTTTTTTIEPTTTTTTTTLTCSCVNIIISQDDIDDATGNTFLNGNVNIEGYIKETTCDDQDITVHYDTAGTYTHCLKTANLPYFSLYYLKDNVVVTNVQSQIVNLGTECSVDGECGPTTTTTTTVVPTTTTTTTVEPTTTTTTTVEPTTTTTSSTSSTTTSTTTVEPTTTTTTTGTLIYYYNATFYNCGDCVTPSGGGSFNNSLPLTPGMYYINSSGTIIYINSFNSVIPGISSNNILDSSQQVNCEDIVCPTTTTTTTLEPTTTTTTTTIAPTTTTTTTADTSCTEVGIDAGTVCPGEEYATVEYTDCEGNVQTIQTNPGELPIVCMLNSSTPVYLCGTGGFQYGGACSTPTTTTTTTVEPTTTTTTTVEPTTTTTTTLGDCLEYSFDGGIDGGTFTYINCVVGPEQTYTASPGNTGVICVNQVTGTTGTVTVTLIGNCPPA
jgi:hypothetical protein